MLQLLVDLVKAFGTANHDLLTSLLKRHRAPDKISSVIKILYTNLKVVLKSEKRKQAYSRQLASDKDTTSL